MAKPWAKLEIDFIDHPKFRALGANAICLWLEGKNYCDKHATDGLIPMHEVKRFRFNGKASIRALLTSAGPKNEQEAYQPLWSEHPIGYRMTGYLEYNPCRDEVMARREDAQDRATLNQFSNAKRQARYRAKLKARAAEARNSMSNGDSNGNGNVYSDVTVTSPLQGPTVPVPVPEVRTPVYKEHKQGYTHPIQSFLALHETLFLEAIGEKPAKYQKRDAKIAKDTIARHGEPLARELLQAFFESSDPFIVEAGRGLNVFAGQINKLLTARRKPAERVETSDDYLERIGYCTHTPRCVDSEVCRQKRASEKARVPA